MIAAYALHPDCQPDHIGLIPSFLSEDDPRKAREQLDQNYAHGGGWFPQDGFTMLDGYVLKYPGDPPMPPLAVIPFRQEHIFIYEYGYVAIVQPDGTFEASRMD